MSGHVLRQRKKMKIERIDYGIRVLFSRLSVIANEGEHALDVDKKKDAQTAKNIIDQIPTEIEELFAFPVKWEVLDKYICIRGWCCSFHVLSDTSWPTLSFSRGFKRRLLNIWSVDLIMNLPSESFCHLTVDPRVRRSLR